MSPAWRIARISLTTAMPEAAVRFYCEALGFEQIATERPGREDVAQLLELDGMRADVVRLRLGQQEVELVAFDPPGRPYPVGSSSSDPWFQHMAIVVSDMHAAYARLSTHPGWTPISLRGPQRLPDSSGGVTAFKFRDPEGHPLELLQFPPGRTPGVWQTAPGPGPFLGIDHSAIVVADTAASASFYSRLGFVVAAKSLNLGIEQERLDGIDSVSVEVTMLHPGRAAKPHLELLCYVSQSAKPAVLLSVQSNDVVATRLVLDALCKRDQIQASDGSGAAMLRDPDGHRLVLLGKFVRSEGCGY
jgi:catechol 2,3-dioxygenase-like lactoylglutathione lyase family enzyme